MMIFPMPESSIRISLKYTGSDVDDASMPIEEVVVALQGFAGAYGKVASSLLPKSTHELRVAAIEPGSFDLSILAWVTSSQGTETLKLAGYATNAARYVFGIVNDFIKAKKHIKGAPPKFSIEGSNNTMIVINNEGGTQAISQEVVNLLQNHLIDPDIAKIASPLSEGLKDNVELQSSDDEGVLSANISSSEKSFFAGQTTTETSQAATISGRLISSNKETRRGTFARTDGKRIPYHYVGDDPISFQSVFAYRGSVKVQCTAYFDENLELKRLDVHSATPLQSELEFPLSQ